MKKQIEGRRAVAAALAAISLAAGCSGGTAGDTTHIPAAPQAERSGGMSAKEVRKSEEQWRKELTPEQYRVLRQKDTERPFTGRYWNAKESGLYCCAGCGQVLFRSDQKFDAGCGWPSFSAPAGSSRVDERADLSHGMSRTEVLCSRCGGHLGHVFNDGPAPTGLRYCINSASLQFEKARDAASTNGSAAAAGTGASR